MGRYVIFPHIILTMLESFNYLLGSVSVIIKLPFYYHRKYSYAMVVSVFFHLLSHLIFKAENLYETRPGITGILLIFPVSFGIYCFAAYLKNQALFKKYGFTFDITKLIHGILVLGFLILYGLHKNEYGTATDAL